MPSEKELDRALESAFATDPGFLTWFLGRTPYRGRGGTYRWSRADHPWCRYELPRTQDESGPPRMVEGETDVIVVFDLADGSRGSLHIENKVSGGHFRPGQPEGYAARARKWMGRADFAAYDSFVTVVVAPTAFLAAERDRSAIFDVRIAHEDIALHIWAFREVEGPA